jgi:predicted GNAT family acetyltransferase
VANPVSNSIYRQIGYRPVEDHVDIRFDPRA